MTGQRYGWGDFEAMGDLVGAEREVGGGRLELAQMVP